MKKYLVVVEKTECGYSAFTPDLDGCIATGKTKDEVKKSMQSAIEFHLEGLKEDGEMPPEPQSYPTYCEVFT